MQYVRLRMGFGGFALATAVAVLVGPAMADDGSWFQSFERISVAPTERDDTTQLIDGGTIATDGFSELVFSLGVEFKEGTPSSGTIGAILIPDLPVFEYLLTNEGRILFALEVKIIIRPQESPIFISAEQTSRIAFPGYRIYLYNETTWDATASLFVYRTRR